MKDQTMRQVVTAFALTLLVACTADEAPEDAAPLKVGKWDHLTRAQQEGWSEASLTALRSHGTRLAQIVPGDIANWCPAYPESDLEEREYFWVGLLSALAEKESTWNPAAVGGGGRWFGLVQISPATARGYGCEARSGEALKNGPDNLSCAIRIWDQTVSRDGVVSAGGRGVAADWGPFHQSNKREDMRAWVLAQPYCQG